MIYTSSLTLGMHETNIRTCSMLLKFPPFSLLLLVHLAPCPPLDCKVAGLVAACPAKHVPVEILDQRETVGGSAAAYE